ncbi:MAG: biotin-dependent carboxyltransferase family protein [Planctomycetota bacterium]
MSDLEATELTILSPGIQTTIQDPGRSGHEASGVPAGGAMDLESAIAANRIVGNRDDDPVLEFTLMGPSIRFSNSTHIAITGADLSPTIDSVDVPLWQRLSVSEGVELRFGKRVGGCRGYLAIAGRIDVPSWLGSVSASTQIAATFTPDSIVLKNKAIRVQQSGLIKLNPRAFSKRDSLTPAEPISIFPGPEFDAFSAAEQSAMESSFTIDASSNRMGYRLQQSISSTSSVSGADSEFSKPARQVWRQGIISSSVFPGVIQVPPSGQPIVLMRDCQTSGGYSRIAVVDSNHLDALAQLAPGDQVTFRWV